MASGNTELHMFFINYSFRHGEKPSLVIGERKQEANTQNNLGRTPLHYASMGSSLEAVDKLIECGAEINLQDISGNTPLHYSAMYGGSISIIKSLLRQGANGDLRNKNGETYLDFIPPNMRSQFNVNN